MSWNAYLTTYLTPTGHVEKAAIFGKADMQCYATENDFTLRHYNATITKDDGSEVEEPVYEDVNLVGWVGTGAIPKQGIRMNGEKWTLLRKAEDEDVWYFKGKNKSGVCFAATGSLVIVGAYQGDEHMAGCNGAVEALAKYLKDSGY